MKMDPIVFRLEVKEKQGFTPFRDEDGNWVTQRDILVKPFNWQSGSGICFDIVEHYYPVGGLARVRTISSISYWDKDQTEQTIKDLMSNLSSNDLRGRIAESTAHILYWKLFAFSDEMKKFLPELVKYYEDTFKVQGVTK